MQVLPTLLLWRAYVDNMKQPDAAMHFKLSMIKSTVRIVTGLLLCMSSEYFIIAAGIGLIVAEAIGIAEEMV